MKYSLFIVILAMFLCESCNGTGGVPGPTAHYSRDVFVTRFYDPSGESSLTIGIWLDVDPVRPGDDRDDWLQKVEIRGDDGLEWIDVTQYYMDFIARAPHWDFDSSYKYTYAAPGTYVMLARATYWDGEVVYSNGSVVTMPHAAP